MTTIPKLSRVLNEVLTERAEALARVSGFVRRRSKLSGSVFVQTLVFGWLGTPMAGIGQLSRVAGALGVRITPHGLEQRFTKEAATYLQQVLAAGVTRLVEREPAAVPILRRFTGVYVQDSTTVRCPNRSLVRAAQVVRQFALARATACAAVAHLATTIRRLAAGLTVGATIDPRRRSPGTWQLLLALDSHIDDPRSSDWAA